MSLKDEIEKLILTERERIDREYKQTEAFCKAQEIRFAPLRAALEEVVTVIDPTYLKAPLISDSHAVIQLGKTAEGRETFKIYKWWDIQPSHDCYKNPQPGFSIDETTYYDYPTHDVRKRTFTLDRESDVVEYILKEVAKEIAHLKSV